VRALKETVVVRKLFQLAGGSVHQLVTPIPRVDAPKARHAIEYLVVVRIINVDTIGTRDYAALLFAEVLMVGKRVQIVSAIEVLPFRPGAILNYGHSDYSLTRAQRPLPY
jgi:hypothetical protein